MHVGYALGVISTATAAGGILGPLAGGLISHWAGLRECFIASGILTLLSASIVIGVKEGRIRRSDFRGRAVSLSQSASQLGIVVGPLLGGLLGGWIGIPYVFPIMGVALLLAAWGVKTRKRANSAPAGGPVETDRKPSI